MIDASKGGDDELIALAAANDGICVSAATLVEVLGFPKLDAMSRSVLEAFFALVTVLQIEEPVIERAISLRQIRKMSLGDALIAATALVHNLALVTRNTRDFSWVPGLTLIDPDAAP